MITEGHDVETASQMVDAMQSLRVGALYLALTFTPKVAGNSSASRKVSDST